MDAEEAISRRNEFYAYMIDDEMRRNSFLDPKFSQPVGLFLGQLSKWVIGLHAT